MAPQSWLEIPAASHFSLANIPFGIISTTSDSSPRPAVAIGDFALELKAFAAGGGFDGLKDVELEKAVFEKSTLNAFASLGRKVHSQVRRYLQDVFSADSTHSVLLRDNEQLRSKALIPLSETQLHLPMEIGDYTDFFAGLNHAHKVGSLFRGPQNALQPNYKHLPVAYHSRASSVIISGTSFKRPWGQVLLDPTAEPKIPTFMPCRRLDIELELGAFVCGNNPLGSPIGIEKAEDYIFGYVLMNDWSARDIQTWEYVPLGPFNAKNFATTISGWVVLAEALEPFRTTGIENDVGKVQEYLDEKGRESQLDIRLEVDLTAEDGSVTTITKTNAKHLLWSFPQMLAHHTVSGCPMRTGDLLGSGTISGTEPGTQGSMLEQNEAGKKEMTLSNGQTRKFLLDGDTVTIRGVCGTEESGLVGFGTCVGTIEKAMERGS